MKSFSRFKALSFFLSAADLLAAGGGTVRESTTSAKGINDDGPDDHGNDDSVSGEGGDRGGGEKG